METTDQPDRELDALVQRALGYEVVGWARAVQDYDDPDSWYLDTNDPQATTARERDDQHPVYVDACVCDTMEQYRRERLEKGNLPESIRATLESGLKTILNHNSGCLRVVPYYTDDWRWAGMAMERMAELGWYPAVNLKQDINGLYWESHMGHTLRGAGYGASRFSGPYAISLAIASTLNNKGEQP